MLGNPNADNPFASTDPFSTSRADPVADDFDTVDIGNHNQPYADTTNNFYGGPSDSAAGSVPAVAPKKTKANRTTKDLEKREKELDKREKALAARESKLATEGRGTGRISNNNWPRCRPMVRHSIAEDVPPNRQRLVRLGYLAWLLMAAGFFWNWVVVLIMFADTHKKLSDWLFASLICGFGLPLSFLLWYFNLYKGAIRDTSFRWWWYFLWASLQPILCGWIAIAPPVVGNWCAGGFTMINQFRDKGGAGKTFGVFCVINLIIFALAGFFGVTATSMAMRTFRGRQQSMGGDVQMQAPASSNRPAFEV